MKIFDRETRKKALGALFQIQYDTNMLHNLASLANTSHVIRVLKY